MATGLVGHGGEDGVGEACGFERDERVGGCVVAAGLGGDGLQDEVVGEAGGVHAEDGVVGHERGLGGRGWGGAGGLRAFDDRGGFSYVLGERTRLGGEGERDEGEGDEGEGGEGQEIGHGRSRRVEQPRVDDETVETWGTLLG